MPEPKQLQIVSVGISVLTNYARKADLPLDQALRRHKGLAEFLKADPCGASAEINALQASTGFPARRVPGLAVTLVASATAGQEGRLAARLIGNFLKQRGIPVAEIKLKDIAVPANPTAHPVEAAKLAEAGLIRLHDAVERHIEKLRRQNPTLEVSINATGGYKAETAILYSLGCRLGVPVYYLHESYRVAIRLPVCAVPF